MTVFTLAQKCGWTRLTGDPEEDREINGCYAGDLLSWVMGRAKEDNLWLTVMGNVNAIAVATLADVSGIVLTESAALDEDAAKRAEQRGIAIFRTEKNTYDTAVEVYRCLQGEG